MGKRKIGNEEIASAMEQRNDGIPWKYIAIGFGCCHKYLQRRVSRAKREGMIKCKGI